jgi:hypothetical protein
MQTEIRGERQTIFSNRRVQRTRRAEHEFHDGSNSNALSSIKLHLLLAEPLTRNVSPSQLFEEK